MIAFAPCLPLCGGRFTSPASAAAPPFTPLRPSLIRAQRPRRAAVAMEAEAPAAAAKAGPPVKDIYTPFWNYATSVLQARLGDDLAPYPIPDGFEHKEAMTGKGKRAALVTTDAYAYQTPKLRQIRTAHVRGGAALQVLNFVIFPRANYRVPFFGADLVTLPGGHLIALDMQPLFHTDEYRKEFSEPFMDRFKEHAAKLPWGGDFPDEAARFFSPTFLWSRPSEDEAVETHVFEAFKDYLNQYLDFVDAAEEVTDPEELAQIRESQIAYLDYRAEKDPARGMFLRFYGEEWTEAMIHGFLFPSPDTW
jgi:phycoerythrobilin:ferredoxin oxidoreductase